MVSIECSGIVFPITEFPRSSYRGFQTLVWRIYYHLTDTSDNTRVVYKHLLTATAPRELETLYCNAYTCAFDIGLRLYR
jgi:hypothetical protein